MTPAGREWTSKNPSAAQAAPASQSASTSQAKPIRQGKAGSGAKTFNNPTFKYYCSVHGSNTSHDTSQCRVLQARQDIKTAQVAHAGEGGLVQALTALLSTLGQQPPGSAVKQGGGRAGDRGKPQGGQRGGSASATQGCEYCKHPKHTKDRCFILHPELAPSDYKPRSEALVAAFEKNKAEAVKRGKIAAVIVTVTEDDYEDDEDDARAACVITAVNSQQGARPAGELDTTGLGFTLLPGMPHEVTVRLTTTLVVDVPATLFQFLVGNEQMQLLADGLDTYPSPMLHFRPNFLKHPDYKVTIPMSPPPHQAKTAYWVDTKLMMYTRMPYGLKNASAKFQRVMDYEIGKAGLTHCAVSFVDDVLIISETPQEHVQHVAAVLDMLHAAGLRAHPDKSIFGADVIEYLGHTLTDQGISPHHAKVAAILALQPPRNVAELHSQLCFINSLVVSFP
ncbi:hypothetical protein GPECTOR_5000g1289 [Gonium pectorale]|uniref:Reverse transcriptase domain-containing protein n=1 Tax=Gonium pectorale TaxID=33097 RepID=A0A150H4S0_GONPE|nr:hypothetical protein GPECTOR_5000g1289 [Gonium pectorale]|eukprot:KXZ57062.1 hypothetical protein GPECTOR_5000g1289 [Gonium pectorale]